MVPDFYDARHAGEWGYRPDQARISEEAVRWRERHGIQPAAADRRRVHMLLIDLQKDFCFPEGSLFVGGRSGVGAVEDSDRTARFIYENLHAISAITCTMDTHYPYQIFSPSFWLQEDGTPPAAHREVTTDDIRSGRLRPDPALAPFLTGGDVERLERQVLYYCEQLEKAGKYTLYLWPPHCILGSDGHALAGVIHEARLFHSWARVAPAAVEMKGDNPLTENYSALAPEVLTWYDGQPLAAQNRRFMELLQQEDMILIAGQAESHCVKSTIDDLLGHVERSLAEKVYILYDCMSSVAVPDGEGGFVFDFTPQAEAALERFAAAGMHVVESTQLEL